MNANINKKREGQETMAGDQARGAGTGRGRTEGQGIPETVDGTMSRIEAQVRVYADAREKLEGRLREFNARVEAVTREAMPELKEMARRVAERHMRLDAALKAAPQLFQRPRTVVFHGMKVGYRRQEGRLEYDDADEVVERVRRLLPNPDPYLHCVTLPDRTALSGLPTEELARLGCRWVEGGDVVLIKPLAGQLDRQIQMLFKENSTTEADPTRPQA